MSNNETLLNGRYRLVAQQGSGGMAVIYKAQDMLLGRIVAVKVLRPSLTADPAFMSRFRNEARSVANLNHPNIVTVHDVGNDGSTQYIVMEFVEGQDLKKIIKAEGGLSIDRTLKLVIQICAGIGFAHRAGLVHADVKPQNILVTRGDMVKVTDFGIAQALSDTQPSERQSVVWGSPHYFAPEQARGERPTPASDVYSIGIVMFELLTGRLPYVGANQQELALAHIREQVPNVVEYNPNVPDTLGQIVYKVMSKEPSARYRMADQLGHVLESYRDRGREQTVSNVPTANPRQSPLPPINVQSYSSPVPPAASAPQPPLPFSQSQAAQPGRGTADPTQRYSAAPDAP
jgi:serine/threonine-protein kinase